LPATFTTLPSVVTNATVPSHLLAVSALVLEDGGDEDEAIGALLHDVVEDQPLRDRTASPRCRHRDRVVPKTELCCRAVGQPPR
jgi:hypothetical protein